MPVVSEFAIHMLPVGGGRLGMSPMPGVFGDYRSDFRQMLRWKPALVVSLTTTDELNAAGVTVGDDLRHAPPAWVHLPIADCGVPDAATTAIWSVLEVRVLRLLSAGDRVLFHCKGGCGRSGMAVLRLMIAAGEPRETALARLRAVRPCAIETPAQMAWATR